VLPPVSLKPEVRAKVIEQTKALALELGVRGLMNIQYAIKDDVVYILEVNPRASRTVPFVSKSIGVPLAKIAAKVMAGKTLKELDFTEQVIRKHYSVKEAVFPFLKFPGIDTLLGPEMLSTGEVMGICADYGRAFGKAQMAAGNVLPKRGTVLFSVKDSDKEKAVKLAAEFGRMGFNIVATKGTHKAFTDNGVKSKLALKVNEGRPNIVDSIINGEISLIINTTVGKKSIQDSFTIRRSALDKGLPYVTTLRAAMAVTQAISSMIEKEAVVQSIQEYYEN
jgi:carbamoyl-phosphate synthase large subunit